METSMTIDHQRHTAKLENPETTNCCKFNPSSNLAEG